MKCPNCQTENSSGATHCSACGASLAVNDQLGAGVKAVSGGSIALGNDLIRVAVQKVGIPLPEAIRMMTENPAKILGIDHQKGHIREGFDADLMLFDENIDVCSVFYAGKEVIG